MRLPKIFQRSSMVINVTAVALIGLLIWAGWAEIDQVSRAMGQVIPAGRVQVIQSADGGVIGEILVREGDRVRRGQKLVVLDPVRIQAAVEESRAKVASYRTVKSRIEAELFNRPLAFTDDVQAFPEFVANQRQLYSRRRTAQAEDIGTLRNMQAIARRELEMNMPLLEFGDVSRSEIMRLQRSVADIEGQIANRQNKYLQDLQAEYSRTEEELVVAEQTLKQRVAALDAAILFAPTDGVVKNVRFTTIGAVLRPGDEVLQIVPTGDKLIIEAKVSPVDIAYLRVGQNASVKFDAYDSSIYGSANGRVTYISPDTLTEQKPSGEQIFYRVNVTADARSLRPRVSERIEIQPGMTATVEIKTGKNTVLGYLLKPISKTFGDSMGER
jgi:adhesin transport system membrane fusion protein